MNIEEPILPAWEVQHRTAKYEKKGFIYVSDILDDSPANLVIMNVK